MEQAQIVADAGADCIEPGAAGVLLPGDDNDAAWQERRKAFLNLPVPCETFNLFLPGHFRIVGTESERTDAETIGRYVFTALRRAREVGGQVIVFGSGRARRVPDGFDRQIAADQIRDFLPVSS